MRHGYESFPLRSYQDDFDTDDNAIDPFMAEATDNPVDFFGVPPQELREELDKRAIDEFSYGDDLDVEDDQREEVEDLDADRRDDQY